MRRLDWRLVGPGRDGDTDGESLFRAYQEAYERARLALPGSSADHTLSDLEWAWADGTVAPCEAVDAPRVSDDPDWRPRIVDEYGETETDMDLEDYLSMRADERDCERCPYATPYSLFPMDPCEFSAGALEEILRAPALVERLRRPQGPQEMLDLAARLEEALRGGDLHEIPFMDTQDYVSKAVHFLRFWAKRGFQIFPEDIDADAAAQREALGTAEDERGEGWAAAAPAGHDGDRGDDEDGEPGPTLH